MSGFLQSTDSVPLDDIDDETVTLLLSSERRKTCKNPGSLINDESTFYANANQTFHWTDDEVRILKQKSLGQAIMVSDFIEEATGDYLRHDGDEARVLLETKTDGYFDNNKSLEQVDHAIDVFEKKFPEAQALFLFDNAPSHRKCSEDSLSAERMNARPWGKTAHDERHHFQWKN